MKVELNHASFASKSSDFSTIHSAVRTALATLFLLTTLAVVSLPVGADAQSVEVWLYAPGGGAYDAIGYTVGGGHVSDPIGDEIGIVNGQGSVYDLDGNLIGYVVVAG
jgi:hypothetical protein